MSLRNSAANNLKKGNYFMDENEPCIVLSIEHSKSGKHGHAKNRVSCVGLFDKKKRSLVFSSGGMVKIPEIHKKTAQITHITDASVTVMDLDSYETFDCDWPDEEVDIDKLKSLQATPDSIGDSTVEYWEIIGKRVIKRVQKAD